MSSLKDLVAGSGPFRNALVLAVTGLGSDPAEVVVDDGGTLRAVPCLGSYRRRAVGDAVLVVQLAGGSWLVLGKIGLDESPVDAVSTGFGTPGGPGWRMASGTWVRAADTGSQVYWDMTGATAAPVVIASTLARSWRDSDVDERVHVGSSDGGSDWTGAWYFGGAIASACSGLTASKMALWVARSDDGTDSGTGVPLLLALHPDAAPGASPSVLSLPWDAGVWLAPGQSAVVAVPDAQRSALASGAALGIAATGSGPAGAMDLSLASLTITFG